MHSIIKSGDSKNSQNKWLAVDEEQIINNYLGQYHVENESDLAGSQ